MLDRLAVGIHSVDVDPGDSRIVRIVIEEIQEIDMGPDIVTDGDDAVDDDAGFGALAGDLAEVFAESV